MSRYVLAMLDIAARAANCSKFCGNGLAPPVATQRSKGAGRAEPPLGRAEREAD